VSAPAVLMTDLAPQKQRDEDVHAAIHVIQHKQMKISKAAKLYSIPRQALGDMVELHMGRNLIHSHT